MAEINNALIPERITIGQICDLHDKIKTECKTILDWKLCVKAFATEHGLTDQEAVAIAHMKI